MYMNNLTLKYLSNRTKIDATNATAFVISDNKYPLTCIIQMFLFISTRKYVLMKKEICV